MPRLDRQRLITTLLASILGKQPEAKQSFTWFTNKHSPEEFKDHFSLVDRLFRKLNGDPISNSTKRKTFLTCDAYFAKPHNFMFEFDEYQHFTSARLLTLENYPKQLSLNFDIEQWKHYCRENKYRADKYRFSKHTSDFNFPGGRSSQRAYLDMFRDFLPINHFLRPTLRICEFEVAGITDTSIAAFKKVELLLKAKLKY